MKRLFLFLLVACHIMLVAKANDGSSLWLPTERNATPSKVVKGSKCKALEELKNFYKGSTPVLLRLDKKAGTGDAFRIAADTQQITLTASTTSGLLYAALVSLEPFLRRL